VGLLPFRRVWSDSGNRLGSCPFGKILATAGIRINERAIELARLQHRQRELEAFAVFVDRQGAFRSSVAR
jgi:hypothetical protein